MTINYKDKFYIYHPDGKFTEEQLMKILDAAYNMGKKDGYSEGYEAGKNSNFSITYPYTDWWKSPWYTTTSRTATNITPTSITTATNTNPSSTTTTTVTNNICREFKYNGTER